MFQIHGGAALADLMRAERAVKAATGAAVKLHVGALPTAATDLFPRAATEFAESHKHCLIHVTTGPNWLLLLAIAGGAAGYRHRADGGAGTDDRAGL